MSSSASEPQANPLQAGQILNQRFEIIELLGSGGMSLVYKALDLRQKEMHEEDPYIALKVLKPNLRQHPELWTLLGQEAKKSQTLSHPNIVNVFDYDKSDDIAYMTMAVLKGESLEHLLLHQELDPQLKLSIARQIIEALLYAHQQGVIHADLKPSNIFIELYAEQNQAKVTLYDFGIARAVRQSSQADESSQISQQKSFSAFSPAYATPKTLRGEVSGIEDDAYALGCVIYTLLTGAHPFAKIQADQVQNPQKQLQKVSRLNSRQWKALKELLLYPYSKSTSSEKASQLIKQLHQAFTQQQRLNKVTLAIATGLGILLFMTGVWFVVPTSQFNAHISELVKTQEWQQIYDELAQNISNQTAIHLSDQQRNTIIAGTVSRYQIAMDINHDDYNPQAAKLLLDSALSQFPDSQSILNLEADFQNKNANNQQKLSNSLIEAMNKGLFCAETEVCHSGVVYFATLLQKNHPRLFEDLKSQLLQSFIKHYVLAEYQENKVQSDMIYQKALLFFSQQQLSDLGFGSAHIQPDPATAEEHHNNAGSIIDGVRLLQSHLDQKTVEQKGTLAGDWQDIYNYMLAFHSLSPIPQNKWRNLKLPEPYAAYFKDENGTDWRMNQSDADAETQAISDSCFQFGRNAFACQDKFEGGQGPALVSLWISAQGQEYRLAISQFELSWRNLHQFCQERQCPAPKAFDLHPVYQLPQELFEEYLSWLKMKTGFEYRLLTLDEWQTLADPLGLLKEFISLDMRTQAPSCRKLGYENDAEFLKTVQVNQGSYDRNGIYNLVDLAPEIVSQGMKRVLVPGRRERLRRCRIDASPYEYPFAAYRVVRLVQTR